MSACESEIVKSLAIIIFLWQVDASDHGGAPPGPHLVVDQEIVRRRRVSAKGVVSGDIRGF